MRYTALLLMPFLMHYTSAFAQPLEIGIIDSYGSITKQDLQKCFPFKENQYIGQLTAESYAKLKKDLVECLTSYSNVKSTDISFICCDESNKWIVYIGADTAINKQPISQKKQDVKLPAALLKLYDSLSVQIMKAIEAGEAGEDNPNGYSLIQYAPARKIQRQFITYANQKFPLLKQVLRYSKHENHRAVAATVIAYGKDKKFLLKELTAAVNDASEDVRNNVIRAMSTLAEYLDRSKKHDLQIPADPFIRLLNSISWTDRNKASLTLLSLSDNPHVQKQLREKALKSMVDMALWKMNGHAIPGLILLSKAAGLSDKEIEKNMKRDRQEVVNEILEKLKNLK